MDERLDILEWEIRQMERESSWVGRLGRKGFGWHLISWVVMLVILPYPLAVTLILLDFVFIGIHLKSKFAVRPGSVREADRGVGRKRALVGSEALSYDRSGEASKMNIDKPSS